MNIVSIGTLYSSLVHPREVFKTAILSNAASIILFHNHPSGDPEPSTEDTTITKRIKEAGTLMGIELLDHVIIGSEGRFYSMKEQGIIWGNGARVILIGVFFSRFTWRLLRFVVEYTLYSMLK